MRMAWLVVSAGPVLAGLLLAGCGSVPDVVRAADAPTSTPTSTPTPVRATTRPVPSPSPSPTSSSTANATPSPTASPEPPAAPAPTPLASDGEPRPARISIPALDLEDFRIRPHRGRPDDARGTRIQDRGAMASPYGTGGLVGPGGLGNYLVTGHRTSSTKPFADLPDLRTGAKVHVEADGVRYTYRITDTRRTSFRSKASLAKQSAAVPGRPGVAPTRAMITLSTCRTPEDRAEGNDWSDRFGNPEHRIDKIGVLVSVARR